MIFIKNCVDLLNKKCEDVIRKGACKCDATCRGFASDERSLPDRLARVSPLDVNVVMPHIPIAFTR